MFVDQVQVNGFHAVYVLVALFLGKGVAKHFQQVVEVAIRRVLPVQVFVALRFHGCPFREVL